MSQEIQLTNEQLIEKKVAAWSAFAVASHNELSELQTMAAKSVAIAFELPTDVEKIAEYTTTLATLKKDVKTLEEKRKGTTSKLDPFLEKFMKPEKQLKEAIPAYENAIIKLKNDKAVIDNAATNKANELKKIKETFLTHINNTKASFEIFIAEYCDKRYSYALKNATTADSINVEGVPFTLSDYLLKLKGTKKVEDFVITQPAVTANFHNEAERNNAWRDVAIDNAYLDGKLMLGKFEGDISDKFKHFAIAFKDPARAVAHSNKVVEETKQAVQEVTDQQNIGAMLSTSATILSNEPTVKPLKETYEVEKPDSLDAAIKIIVAFTANIGLTKNKVGIKIFENLSVKQMASALADVKNDDNKFEVSGVNFKIVQKLK